MHAKHIFRLWALSSRIPLHPCPTIPVPGQQTHRFDTEYQRQGTAFRQQEGVAAWNKERNASMHELRACRSITNPTLSIKIKGVQKSSSHLSSLSSLSQTSLYHPSRRNWSESSRFIDIIHYSVYTYTNLKSLPRWSWRSLLQIPKTAGESNCSPQSPAEYSRSPVYSSRLLRARRRD